MNIFNVVESLVSILELNNSDYFYKFSDILKEFFFFFFFMSYRKNWQYLVAMLILSEK